jgi:hypothetical protein
MVILNLKSQPQKIRQIKRKKDKELLQKNKSYFKGLPNPNFAIALDAIITTLLGLTQLIHY